MEIMPFAKLDETTHLLAVDHQARGWRSRQRLRRRRRQCWAAAHGQGWPGPRILHGCRARAPPVVVRHADCQAEQGRGRCRKAVCNARLSASKVALCCTLSHPAQERCCQASRVRSFRLFAHAALFSTCGSTDWQLYEKGSSRPERAACVRLLSPSLSSVLKAGATPRGQAVCGAATSW